MTGRFMGALLSPNPMASMILPACLLSLGSKVSMWLTPPHMNRKITDFALAGKCGTSVALGIEPALAHSPPQRQAQETAAGLVEKGTPPNAAAGIKSIQVHVQSYRSFPRIGTAP